MKNSWFQVLAQAEKKVQVAIRGLIGEWGITDRDLIAQVDALGEADEITVVINSRGGEVDHAISIFNYLRAHAAKIVVRVEGMAASSASLIAMAGDEIIMPANTLMMVHNPWTYTAGNAKQLRATADMLDKFESSLREIYIARTGKTEDEIKALLEGEDGDGVFMTAQEAKNAGFCDVVEAVEAKGKSADARALVFASALGIPDAILAKLENAVAEDSPDEPEADQQPVDEPVIDQPGETLAAIVKAVAGTYGMAEYLPAFAVNASITDKASAEAVIGNAREIVAICETAGKPEMASAFIKDGADLAKARAELFNVLANEDERTSVSTASATGPDGMPANAGAAKPAELKTSEIWALRRNQSQH